MFLNKDEVKKRLNNPMNLINQMNNRVSSNSKTNAMSLFIRPVEKNITGSNGNKTVIKEAAPSQEVAVTFNNPFSKSIIIQEEPTTDELIKDSDAKVKLALAHDNAIELLNRGINMMTTKLDNVKPEKLPSVINAASKVVDNIRRERIERSKTEKDQEVHFHFYEPARKQLSEYEVIEVSS